MSELTQPTLFPPPELPPETRLLLNKLPPNEELGPVEPDSDFCRNVEGQGVFNPVAIKRSKDGYRVVEGKRRIKAARKCGQKYVPVRIYPEDWPDEEITQLSLHENRKPNLISELEAFEGALAKGETPETIKRKVGMKQAKVRILTKLQNLIPELRQAMSKGDMKPSVAYIAAKLPKSDQKKLLKPLKETGRVKVKDIKEVQVARRDAALASLPDSLFEDDGDWKIAAMSKLGELRNIVVPHGNQFERHLQELEKKIKGS